MMRILYFLLLMSVQPLCASSIYVPFSGEIPAHAISATPLSNVKTQKQGIFQKIATKRVLKYLKKRGDSYETPNAIETGIMGLILNLISVACIFLGAELLILLGLVGFFVSISALRKSLHAQSHKRLSMLLAIAGLVLNGLLVAGIVIPIIGASMFSF